MTNKENNNDLLFQILKEIKEQSNLLRHLNSEINQLKQTIALSKNISVNPSSFSHLPNFNPNEKLLTPEKSTENLENMIISQSGSLTSFPVNVEEISKNLDESNQKKVIDLWKNCKEIFNKLAEMKNNSKFDNFIENAFKLFINVFIIFFSILQPKKEIDISEESSLINLSKEIGPLPVVLDFELIDFINDKITRNDYSIGEKTAEKLFENINISFISIGEFLGLII